MEILFFVFTPIVVALTMLCIILAMDQQGYHTIVLDLNKLQQTIHAFMFNHELSLFK
jgi:hypothetical protein